MRAVPFRLVLVFAAVVVPGVSGCMSDKKSTVAGDSAPIAAGVSSMQAIVSPDNSFDVQVPGRWVGVYRVDSLSSAERGTARPGAVNVVYLPRDTTVLPQTLVVVAVYDSAAWQRVKAEGGPPPGDSVKSQAGRVYVLALPQSNPFVPGSIDALKFDSLALTTGEKASLIHVR